MAILDSLLGVEVEIWSDGSKLTEYDDLGDKVRQSWKHKTVSKYIESESDAEFFFRLKVGKPYEHDCDELGFSIILDGCEENVDSHLCSPENLEDGEWEYDVHGVETYDAEGAKLKRFKFSKLRTTDGETRYLTDREIEDIKKIGQIEVRVHQLQHCRSVKPKPKQLRGALDTIPEKFLGGQAISHSISYDSEEPLSAPSFYLGTKYMHGWNGPIGVFRFKYRSRDDLQKELIIARTPSPEAPGPPSVAELTLEQKVRLARMRYDDEEMLKSLTGARKHTASQKSTSQRNFEDLTLAEIDLLALEKHSEMTGVPLIKPELGICIKKELGAETGTSTNSYISRRRPFKVIPIAEGKRAVDLTSDDDEPDPRFVTPQNSSRSRSRSTSFSTPQSFTPPSAKKHPEPDPDELEIYAVRRAKRLKTWSNGRPSGVKKERWG